MLGRPGICLDSLSPSTRVTPHSFGKHTCCLTAPARKSRFHAFSLHTFSESLDPWGTWNLRAVYEPLRLHKSLEAEALDATARFGLTDACQAAKGFNSSFTIFVVVLRAVSFQPKRDPESVFRPPSPSPALVHVPYHTRSASPSSVRVRRSRLMGAHAYHGNTLIHSRHATGSCQSILRGESPVSKRSPAKVSSGIHLFWRLLHIVWAGLKNPSLCRCRH